jgi:general secretion pathway protein D
VRVTADKPTNCLIVMSGAHDYAELRRVIDELDRTRRQVFIEAVILEVAHGNDQSFGLDYHAGTMSGKSLLYGGLNPVDSITGATSLQALALGVRGPELEGAEKLLPNVPAGLSIPAFGVALTALAVRSSSDVLSTPHILTLDNTEAEINIGENIPLQINSSGSDLSSLAGVLGAASAGQGLQGLGALGALGGTPRQDVGTRIQITPHINTDNQVRLEIEEEISEPGLPAGDLGAVSIVQRSARTTVVVDDEQTIVIGGLVRDTKTNQHEGIPLLSDIPLLGALFRKSTSTVKKTNLILILTPHVIDSQEDLRRVFARKMQERQEFLDRYFVFNSDWQPPRDYAHASGLVEEIRHAWLAQQREAQLSLDAAPRAAEIHEPTAPLDLPARPPTSTGAAAKPAPAKSPSERRTRP